MRLCIFSDVHSNLEALQAVLEAAASAKVDQVLCAGDLVGYAADPGRCLALLKERLTHAVCGNHDWAVAGKLPLDWFNPQARAGLEWTRRQLSLSDQQYVSGLPLLWQDAHMALAHGSLHEPEKFHYILDAKSAGESFRAQKTPISFIGHTHVPGIFVKEGERISFLRVPQIRIDPKLQYLINVGSVGQPRDGDPRAAWCLYDTDRSLVEIQRVPYPLIQAQEKILAAGLPEFLAERLAYGY